MPVQVPYTYPNAPINYNDDRGDLIADFTPEYDGGVYIEVTEHDGGYRGFTLTADEWNTIVAHIDTARARA